MGALQKLRGGSGFDLAILSQFRFDNVKWGMETLASSAHANRFANNNRVPEPDGQLRGHGIDIMREQAMGHDAVEQRAGHAAVQNAGIALKCFRTPEHCLDAPIGT